MSQANVGTSDLEKGQTGQRAKLSSDHDARDRISYNSTTVTIIAKLFFMLDANTVVEAYLRRFLSRGAGFARCVPGHVLWNSHVPISAVRDRQRCSLYTCVDCRVEDHAEVTA